MLSFISWEVITIAGIVVGALGSFFLLQLFYLAAVFAWGDQKTQGLNYYGLPLADREKFKRALRRNSVLLFPILRFLSKTSNFKFQSASFTVKGVAGPKGTCSAASFEQALAAAPQAGDVFVATQMKCGTTWMQHVIYEVLQRGDGKLVENGEALYSQCPWIEASKSVPLDDAPRIGTEHPSRVIKTHLPTKICPYSEDAKYIYVVRHPVSCFASCVDFVATNVGAFAPPLGVTEEWFCSDEMWWGPWTDHVDGWWKWSEQRDNVLFVTFEDMKRDLRAVVLEVAAFLQMAPLSDEEVDRVVEKCGFKYMKEHSAAFEMHPPHILQTDAELFISGKADRHKDVPDDVRARVLRWAREGLEGSEFPLDRFYPDVAGAND